MLLKCVKYYDANGNQTSISQSIEKGKFYPVLAISTMFSTKQVYYYIQATINNNYTPHWSDARQYEIVDPKVYSGWSLDINNSLDVQTLELMPMAWKENESWFIDELIEETPRAVELFIQERDKICLEMEYYK